LNKAKPGVKVAVRAFRQRLEREILASGGGGVGVASRIHSACLSLRRHLETERKIADAKEITFEQWERMTAASQRFKAAVDKAIDDLGMKVHVENLTEWQKFQRMRDAEDLRQAQDAARHAAAATANGSHGTAGANCGDGNAHKTRS
jgi:hypothetical protein